MHSNDVTNNKGFDYKTACVLRHKFPFPQKELFLAFWKVSSKYTHLQLTKKNHVFLARKPTETMNTLRCSKLIL
jgi:hypothetical protein